MDASVPAGRSARSHMISIAVASILLAAAVAGWVVESRRSAQDVGVKWSLRCGEGTTVLSAATPVIESKRGWACDVVLTVTNRSRWDVTISRVEAPTMGPEGRSEIEGHSVAGARLGESDSAEGVIDAWLWRTRVHGHSRASIMLPIGWREQGCNEAGGFSFPDWPTIHFSSLGLSHSARSQQTLTFKSFDDPHDRVACPL